MEKYMISPANILIADIAIFDRDGDYGEFKSRKLSDADRFRKILCINGRYFDLKTGEECYECEIKDGYIYGPIFANTKYVTKTWRSKNISERDVLRGALLFNYQLKMDELVSSRKVLLLPREQIL